MIKKEELASAILGFIILISWHIFYALSCFSLIFPIIICFFIFKTIYNFNSERKKCEAACYFKEKSFLYRWLTQKKIIFISAFIGSAFLTAVLSLNIISFTLEDFIIFAIDMVILHILYEFIEKESLLKKKIKSSVLINIVSWLNAVFLTILLFFIALYQTPPQYLKNDLWQTINEATKNYSSVCDFIDEFLFFIEAIQATKWWIVLKLSLMDIKYYIKETIWLIFLINNYLLVFSFGKYILEIKNFTRKITNNK